MMNETKAISAVPQQDKDYEAAVDRYLIEIEHIRREMAESQRRIERLRTETTGMLHETQTILNKLTIA